MTYCLKTLKGWFAGCAIALGVGSSALAVELPENDYPTWSRADYVFGCMQANGQNRDVLLKCSCSIDEIAHLLPFSKYEAAETLMSVGLRGGENASWLIHSPENLKKINELKLAQVEAELLCF